MPTAAFTPRCSCPVLPEAHCPPHAHRRAPLPLLCYLRSIGPLQRLQLSTRSRVCVVRGVSSSLESATAAPGSLDQPAFPAGGAVGGSTADGNGAPVKDDGKVMVTFRWPAALGGRDVSVVGACRPTQFRSSVVVEGKGIKGLIPSSTGDTVLPKHVLSKTTLASTEIIANIKGRHRTGYLSPRAL